ncbi:MAG TPA: TolC family protein [Dyella sp.]|uniref:TolC family protein n=1 Tax=Dyella sp. TaxID=1869338 RepID=UPI002C09E659|nr:TolC family protein [Dyella sp.]HTV85547.1 TolC family protein [Dyella sp.]
MTRLIGNTVLVAALALAGCASVGPDYKAPATPSAHVQGIDAARESAVPFQAAWWRQFNDPVLDALIEHAAKGGLDLRIARARLGESRALLGTAKSDQIPTIGTDLSYSRAIEQQPGFTPTRVPIDTYQAGFDASWEVDIFGGVRRSVEAARADLGASEASLQDAQVSLFAEVARNYFELRGTQERLAIARRNIANQADTLKLIQARAQIGTASEQDVASASAQLSAARSQLPVLDAQERGYAYRLAVLLGERPGELDVDISPATFKPIATALPIGDAGNALSRRPDVRIAERQYAAATARIGVAKADFFPHLSLGGFVGFLAGRSNDFGGPASRAFSFGPSITWNGLNVERVRSNLHVSEARADAAQANYQRTVLSAIEDVDNAIVGYNAEHARIEQLIAQSEQSKRAADLARIRYQEGATGYLELLDAERVQLAAEDELAQSEAAIDTRAVALYKALGGGWQACTDTNCTQLASTVATSP